MNMTRLRETKMSRTRTFNAAKRERLTATDLELTKMPISHVNIAQKLTAVRNRCGAI
jgi:hypothetical protein